MAAANMMKYRKLGNTNMLLSIVSLGGSGYGKNYGAYDEKEAVKAFQHAIHRGVNYIDTAYWYGQGHSETFLGRELLPKVPRDKYFIATKVGRYEEELKERFDFSAEKVTKSAEESLKRLQLEEVDLLQIHDVEFALSNEKILNETLPAVEKLQKRGLCRYIGITGYPLSPLKDIISKSDIKIDSILSYCRLSLNDWTLVDDFKFFREKGVAVINACPVGMGLLTETGPQDWHPAHPWVKEACLKAVDYCKKNNVDITRLALNYSTSFKEAATTLVSMCDTEMVDKNIDAAINPLTDHEQEVQEHLINDVFGNLTQRHWEGVELIDYWHAI
jgi:aryl-alcohol dehydrogenase-like predicted oxidoreductase